MVSASRVMFLAHSQSPSDSYRALHVAQEHLRDDGHSVGLSFSMAGAVFPQRTALRPHTPKLGKGAGFKTVQNRLTTVFRHDSSSL